MVRKNLLGLEEVSTMTPNRRRMLEALFENYTSLEVSLGEILEGPTEITATLEITRLINTGGEVVNPVPILRNTRVTIPREGDQLGKVVW